MSYLVDTNILSELVRHQPNAGVTVWAKEVRTLALSVITLEELRYGLAWRPNPKIAAWFEDFFRRQCRIIPITERIALRCGDLRGQLRARGQSRTQADMLIAATASVHALTLVTRNEKDFEGCAIPILNPYR